MRVVECGLKIANPKSQIPNPKMIHRIIELCLKNRALVIALYIGVAAWGYWALIHTPIDAIPDLSDNQVIVFTDWAGRSPQEVEDQVTYPLVTNLQGLPGVRVVRASSAFSFSTINIIFEDNVDLYWARTRVLERLNLVSKQLPENVTPTLGPDATGVGQIFWYTLESDTLNLRELRTTQDWFVRYQLTAWRKSHLLVVMFSNIKLMLTRISCAVTGLRCQPLSKPSKNQTTMLAAMSSSNPGNGLSCVASV